MKSKYNKSDYIGSYRWAEIDMDTLARIDPKTGDGFMVNKPLYRDMLDWLSKEEKQKFKINLLNITSWSKNKAIYNNFVFWYNDFIKFIAPILVKIKKLLWIKQRMLQKILMKPKYHKIYIDKNVSIIGILWNNWWGLTNKLTLVIDILGRKYFLKQMNNDVHNVSNYEILLNTNNEYRWLVYLDNYFKSTDDISIIKPVLSYDLWETSFIIYPFVDSLVLVSKLKTKNPKLYKLLKNRYDDIYNKLNESWIVSDLKMENTFVDTNTHKIYIFDPLYHQKHEK